MFGAPLARASLPWQAYRILGPPPDQPSRTRMQQPPSFVVPLGIVLHALASQHRRSMHPTPLVLACLTTLACALSALDESTDRPKAEPKAEPAAVTVAGQDLPAPYRPSADNQRLNLFGVKPPPAPKTRTITWPAQPGQAEICLWRGDKFAAASIGIDDNWMPNHQWWLDLCAKHGIKVTWFAVAGGINGKNSKFNGRWEDYRKLVAVGHDVQSHTINHFGPKDQAEEERYRQEYAGSIRMIESNIPGHRCLAVAYPMGAGNHDIASEYFIAARGTNGAPSSPYGTNYLNTSIGSGTEDAVNAILGLPVAGAKWLASPNFVRGWIQPLYHGAWDMAPGAEPQKTAKLVLAQVEYLVSHRERIWIDLFVTVAKYGQERDSATLTTVSADADTIRLSLTDLMRDDIFDLPLTVKVRLPDGWTTAQARQGEAAIAATIVTHDGSPYALVEAIPDRGGITIVR